jgi:hypothetical protein
MALNRRHPKPGLLHHSDQGSQYAATAYQRQLRAAGLTGSLSRRGNCWDNTCVESFFGTVKRELIHQRQYPTREEARQETFDYLEVFEHRQRRRSTLGYQTPSRIGSEGGSGGTRCPRNWGRVNEWRDQSQKQSGGDRVAPVRFSTTSS